MYFASVVILLTFQAARYLEKIIIQAQQTREKKRLLLQQQNSDKESSKNDPPLDIDPKAFCKLGHFHLLLEDYFKGKLNDV